MRWIILAVIIPLSACASYSSPLPLPQRWPGRGSASTAHGGSRNLHRGHCRRPPLLRRRVSTPIACADGAAADAPTVADGGGAANGAPDPSHEQQLERFFFDRCEVFVRSGAGGDGALGFVGKRPAGGSGGRGGDVYVECTADYNTLAHLQGRASFHAGRGADADARQAGRDGAAAVVRVPPNCRVVERDTNRTVGTLLRPGERLLVAGGGEGGEGNGEVWRRTRTSAKGRTAPGGTERLWLSLSMLLVADVGLVGLPNAGKSTLLRAVTRARPKVADYPFTTLIPNLGVCEMDAFGLRGARPMVWLDIPGLIEGAASGRGLGLAFLRHTERCRLLLHLVSGESDDPVADFTTINAELQRYSPALAAIPQVVVLTKADLPEAAERAAATLEALKAAAGHGRAMTISSLARKNLAPLLKRTSAILGKQPSVEGRDDGEA